MEQGIEVGDWKQNRADFATEKFNRHLEEFRNKKSFLYLPSDFKAVGMDLSTIYDPNFGRHPSTGTETDPATGQPVKGSNNTNFNPDFGLSFGTNGTKILYNTGALIGYGVKTFEKIGAKLGWWSDTDSVNEDTQNTITQITQQEEIYNQKKHKHKDLFFNIIKNNQTGRIFAGGDLYNAGAGSKQYDPLSPYEPYKYFMEQSDISLEDIRVILKDDLPKAGKQSYYPGIDSEIDWAGGNKSIRASQLILNTSLRTTYQKFQEEAKTFGRTLNGKLEFNYSLNDLLNRRIRALTTDFKLKNK